jgi:hypothetical protein
MSELNLIREEENARAMALTTETVVTHDTSEEFSLPDYVPEIRRLLNVRAQVLPESKYIADKGSGSVLEFGGTVTYLLIYTDDEGNLCSLPLSSSYEAETGLASHPSLVLIDTSIDSLSSRVNAPRRITVKSRLKSKISGWENASYAEDTSGKSTAEEMTTQRLTKEEKVMSLQQISMQNIRVSDKLDTQGEENLRPLWCDATAFVTDARVQNGSVSVRGKMKVRCLCKKETVTLS